VRVNIPIAGLLLVAVLVALVFFERASARQAVLVQPTEELRFQLIGNETIAGPDGRAQVAGWSVLVFKDRRANVCHLAFRHLESIAMGGTIACPR
jgi:hypothetical protein